MSYAKALREQLAPLAAKMEAIVDLAKKQNNRGLTSEERTKFHALESDYTAIEDSISVAEKGTDILAKLAAPFNPGGEVRISESQMEELRNEFQLSPAEKRRRDNAKNPHASAFSAYLRMGENRMPGDVRNVLSQISADLPQDVRNAMSTTTGSQGGYVIPAGFSGLLEEAKKWFGGIDGVVGKFATGTGNPFPWPTVNDTNNKGRIIGQNTQITETDIVFGQVTFNAYIGSSDIVLVPLALIEDSYFDMDALVARLLGIRLGRLYNQQCTVGTGTNTPTGIVTAAVAAGNIYQCPTGETAAIAYNDLVNLEHSVDPDYRFNPSTRWMFSDAMLKLLKKLVDGNNRPLWQPGLTASFREGAAVDLVATKPTILDHPYIINQDMASPAANAYTVVFGDQGCFKVREVAGGTTVLVLRERYADYLQVGYTAFQRLDSNLIDAGTHPLAVLQQSAS